MESVSMYASSWRALVGRAIRSYRDAIENLVDGREYHGSRSFLSVDDADADHRRVYAELPLLWGTF